MRRWLKWALYGAALLLLLALDSYMTYSMAISGNERVASASVETRPETGDALSQFRLEREQLRARQEAQLNDIIYSDKSDSQTVALAQEQLLSLLNRAEQELTLEGLLQGRGFEDALVSVGERSANVLLRTDAVTQRESAVILELVLRETGLTGGNVKIIPVK